MKSSTTDAQIQDDVLRELEAESHVDRTEIGVEVRDQVVTLTGTVTSWAKKLAAADAAHRAPGVRDVANDLVVKPVYSTVRNDSEIATAIRHALMWDVFVPEDRIRTTVSNGVVTLSGEVDYSSQRDDAARAIGNLAGVCAIDNRIVATRTSATTGMVKTAIRTALERHAAREAAKIRLEVERGQVVLEGQVDSWEERDVVVGAAKGTRGVESVIDRLSVKLPPL
jgi:osmotically-inducible protein OsmY